MHHVAHPLCAADVAAAIAGSACACACARVRLRVRVRVHAWCACAEETAEDAHARQLMH